MRFFLSILISLILASCASQGKPGIELYKYRYSSLTGWNNQNISNGFKAFQKSCAVLSGGKMQSHPLISENNNIWRQKCAGARVARDPKLYFENNFSPYLVSSGGDPKGKFTGYFEKEIEAAPFRNDVYKYPIYAAPNDPRLLNLSRREIENGALNGQHLEIAYAKSLPKLFFLHIQGSGILRFPDGKRVEVGYSAKNNKPYTGIGSYMLTNGLIKHGSADEIVAWLERHPVTARSIMNMNERYVFFSLKNGGPYGSMGIELTDQASLAIDPEYIPFGVPLWLQTTLPVTKAYFTRLMNAQDTGSAIKGPIRGDIFFGEGAWASQTASGMNAVGNYFMLVPKEINPLPYF